MQGYLKYGIIPVVKKFEITPYQLQLNKKGLPKGRVRIAYLSDLHNCQNGPNNRVLLQALRRLQPDLILCGGDMIVGRPGQSVETGRSFMLRVAGEFPVYAGTGNHEYRTRIYPETYPHMYTAYHDPLRKAGVHFLENESALVSMHGIPLRIYGFECSRTEYRRFRRQKTLKAGRLEKQFGRPAPEEVSILLAHTPQYLASYLKWGADLTLCGHYHGGICRFGEHTGAISPGLELFTPLAHGHYAWGLSHAIVGAGLGEHTLPLRFHNPRELVVVDLSVN